MDIRKGDTVVQMSGASEEESTPEHVVRTVKPPFVSLPARQRYDGNESTDARSPSQIVKSVLVDRIWSWTSSILAVGNGGVISSLLDARYHGPGPLLFAQTGSSSVNSSSSSRDSGVKQGKSGCTSRSIGTTLSSLSVVFRAFSSDLCGVVRNGEAVFRLCFAASFFGEAFELDATSSVVCLVVSSFVDDLFFFFVNLCFRFSVISSMGRRIPFLGGA